MWRIGLILVISGTVLAEPIEISESRKKSLINLLKNDCGACHGLTLKGGLGSSLRAKDLAGKSNALLVSTIQNGRKGTAMPPWKKFISRQETFWLIDYLRNNK